MYLFIKLIENYIYKYLAALHSFIGIGELKTSVYIFRVLKTKAFSRA